MVSLSGVRSRNPNLELRWTLMPAMIAALSMLQTLGLSALSVAREREQGIFDQLLVTPLTPYQIMIGKALPTILVGLIQSTIILLNVRFWYHIPMQGSYWLLWGSSASPARPLASASPSRRCR